MENDDIRFLIMTTETPPRFMNIIAHGKRDAGGRPWRNEFTLTKKLEEARQIKHMEDARKLHDILSLIYPRLRFYVQEGHTVEVEDE